MESTFARLCGQRVSALSRLNAPAAHRKSLPAQEVRNWVVRKLSVVKQMPHDRRCNAGIITLPWAELQRVLTQRLEFFELGGILHPQKICPSTLSHIMGAIKL